MIEHNGSAPAPPSLQWGVVELGLDRGDDAVARRAAEAFQHGGRVQAVRTLGLHLCSAWAASTAERDDADPGEAGPLAFLGQGAAVLTTRRLLIVLTTGATPAGIFGQADGTVLLAQLGLRDVARTSHDPSTYDTAAAVVHIELEDGAAISLETSLESGAMLVATVGSTVQPAPARGAEAPKG